MGSFCCCLCTDEFEEYLYPSNTIYRSCACLRVFFHQLLNGYGATFHRLDGRPVTPDQAGTSLVPTGAVTGVSDGCTDDPHVSLSRPVSFDHDQRYTRLQQDGLVSRKSMTHFQEESHPLRRNASSSGAESLGFSKKRDINDPEEDSRLGLSVSDKILPKKLTHGLSYVETSSEDEDVCPTCLDEYATENPKITTRCSHHFHLGCIYEWLERSETCPICGKDMDFCESP